MSEDFAKQYVVDAVKSYMADYTNIETEIADAIYRHVEESSDLDQKIDDAIAKELAEFDIAECLDENIRKEFEKLNLHSVVNAKLNNLFNEVMAAMENNQLEMHKAEREHLHKMAEEYQRMTIELRNHIRKPWWQRIFGG